MWSSLLKVNSDDEGIPRQRDQDRSERWASVPRTCVCCFGDLLLTFSEEEELKPNLTVILCWDSHREESVDSSGQVVSQGLRSGGAVEMC